MRVRAVMMRILRQLAHDKRTIGLMILAPILVLTFMAFIFDGTTYHPRIGIINAPLHFVRELENNDAVVIRYSESEAFFALKASEVDAIINFESGIPHIDLEGSDPGKAKAVMNISHLAMKQTNMEEPIEITYVYGYKDMSDFDSFGPILIGFFVFFFVFLISGVAFLRERDTGTLERALATPIHRWEIVMGYICGYGVFTVLQSTLIAWYAIYMLKIMMVGSFGMVLLITILTAMVGLSIGIFISAFASNELQMIQFIPIIIVPQMFFSGLFDLSTMAPWLQLLGRMMPLWYVSDALTNVMIRGKGWNAIFLDAAVLLIICLIFVIANIFALKKYRKI